MGFVDLMSRSPKSKAPPISDTDSNYVVATISSIKQNFINHLNKHGSICPNYIRIDKEQHKCSKLPINQNSGPNLEHNKRSNKISMEQSKCSNTGRKQNSGPNVEHIKCSISDKCNLCSLNSQLEHRRRSNYNKKEHREYSTTKRNDAIKPIQSNCSVQNKHDPSQHKKQIDSCPKFAYNTVAFIERI